MKEIKTKSGLWRVRKAKPDEIQHTSPAEFEIPVIAECQTGEWVYMLLDRVDVMNLLK